jgi:hypothetical protein
MAAVAVVQARMGFDPRQWRPSASSRPITSNVEALLAENDALHREVRALRLQLELLLAAEPSAMRGRSSPPGPPGVTTSSSFGVTPEQVALWSEAMARHPQWRSLRIGSPGGLRALVEEQRRHWWNPRLELEQELDRRCPGLGAELVDALRGPHSRGRWAVRAAFALYGQRAPEWLSDAPLRVVEELVRRLEQLERRTAGGGKQQRRRGTRTHNHSTDADDGQGPPPDRPPDPPADPRQRALQLLGLKPDCSRQAIKRAYRRLAKSHHPDLGGDVEAFRRLDAAYRLLMA